MDPQITSQFTVFSVLGPFVPHSRQLGASESKKAGWYRNCLDYGFWKWGFSAALGKESVPPYEKPLPDMPSCVFHPHII